MDMRQAKFPSPWHVDQVAEDEWMVTDANGRNLFYIKADEGDDRVKPTVLFWGDNGGDDTTLLIGEIAARLSETD